MFEAVKLHSTSKLVGTHIPEHVKVTFDVDGHLRAVSWIYNTSDSGLHGMVKRRGGSWNHAAGGWVFPNPVIAQEMLDTIIKRNPDWPVVGHPDRPFLPMSGVSISHLRLSTEIEACLTPAPLPAYTQIEGKAVCFQLTLKGKSKIGLLLGLPSEIRLVIASLTSQGARIDDTLTKKMPAVGPMESKLKVKVSGWAVHVTCDLTNPLHYQLAPPQQQRWEGQYPFGVKVDVPWRGEIRTTRKGWPALKAQILSVGLKYEGDDPESDISVMSSFDVSKVAGWDAPAPNGHLLHAYQKKGVEFCVSRGMRALIGDEMGVGKTVQAIASAEACAAPRVLVICSANARYVWDREIQGWGGRGSVQHVTSQLDTLDLRARWHICTYDLIAKRAEIWRFKDDAERAVFIKQFPAMAQYIAHVKGSSSIVLEKPLDTIPVFESKRLVAWEKVMRRLRGELLEQILNAGQMLVILDEAHRAKNKAAKRTRAIQSIADSGAQLLMLTGTPLRNNEHEAATLLGLLDNQAAAALSKRNGYTVQDIKDYLGYFMIRRTKAEVLPELPPKIRQRIDIEELDASSMETYFEAMDFARESYTLALARGKSDAEARQAMRGGIERARTALGVAKVLGGSVKDLVLTVVENTECCVVFCAHHEASDTLMEQLKRENLRVAVVDGRTSQKERAALVDQFQSGQLDVFIGGINAAGEAITLTRADTVIFAELDWVPAALLQAEDRIHRVGQQSSCQIIQLVARIKGVRDNDNLDAIIVELTGDKMAKIGVVLGENTDNIIAGSVQAQLYDRLLGRTYVASKLEALVQVQFPGSNPVQNSESFRAVGEPAMAKRKRGRPRIYVDKAPPSGTARSKSQLSCSQPQVESALCFASRQRHIELSKSSCR